MPTELEKPAGDSTDHPVSDKGLWATFWRGWPKVIPVLPQFIACLFVLSVLVSGAAYWLSAKFHEGENRAQAATIQTVSTERDAYHRQLEDAGLVSTSLKKRAIILCNQMDQFARNWPTNPVAENAYWDFANRFGGRIERIVAELDEHGQHDATFDRGNTQTVGPATFKPQDAFETSSRIRKMAEQLKD